MCRKKVLRKALRKSGCCCYQLNLSYPLLPHRSREIWFQCGKEIIEVHEAMNEGIDNAEHARMTTRQPSNG